MKPTWCSIYSLCIYQYVHVSGNYGPTIRRNKLCLCNTFYLLFCTDDCLVCRSICSCIPASTYFGRLWAHQQEEQLCLCYTLYLLFCMDDCLVCRSICSCIPASTLFRRLWAHQQEEQLCLCDTLYLLFCMDDCLVCRSICSCITNNW